VPFVVDVHDEPGWARLLQTVPLAGEHARGIGVPSGGGALYHPDYSVEPVRHPLAEVSQTESGVQQALLLPGQASVPAAGAATADKAADSPEAGGGTTGGTSPGRRQGGTADADIDRERSELGYSIDAYGVINLRRPEDPRKEPVN
jgi:hypothetical protein